MAARTHAARAVRCFVLAVCAAIAVSRATASPAAAVTAGLTVRFMEPTPWVQPLKAGDRPTLWVMNSGSAPSRLRLYLVNLAHPPGMPALGLAAAPADGQVFASTDAPIGIGSAWPVPLPLAADLTPGTYAARLVVLDESGGFDLLMAQFLVAGPGSAGLRPPLPAQLTLSGERSVVAPIDASLNYPIDLPIDRALVGSIELAAVSDDRGHIAVPITDAYGIRFLTAPAPGSYHGVLASRPTDGSAPLALSALTINVRDAPLWALVALVAGVALATLSQRWFSLWAPQLILRARINELGARSWREAEAVLAERASGAWAGANREPVRVFDPGPPPAGLLVLQADSARADFAALPSPDLRDARWGPAGSEWAKLSALVDVQTTIAWRQRTVNELFGTLRSMMPGPLGPALEASAVGREARTSLAGGLITRSEELMKLEASLSDLEERLNRLVALAQVLDKLAERTAGAARPRLDGLRARLADLATGSVDEIEALARDIGQLNTELAPSAAQSYAVGGGGSADDISDLMAVALPPAQEGVGATGGDGYGEDPRAIAGALRRGNLVFLALVTGFALLSGMATQYLANPTFGSLADYAGLLLWGFGTSALAQLAKSASAVLGRLPLALPGA